MNEQFILTLVDKFSTGNLTELEIKEGELHIQLKKDTPLQLRTPLLDREILAPAPADIPLSVPLSTLPKETQAAPGVDIVTSPIVGTFYAASSPAASPYVSVGSAVKAGDTLCILEAMKMMNHLEADFDGTVIAILVKNGEMVEYGQPLFEIQRL